MEKVNIYSCVEKPLFLKSVNKNSTTVNPVKTGSKLNTLTTDVVNFKSSKNIYLNKLDKLFPNGGFEKLYNDINKDFNIDKPAKIKLVGNDDGITAGGFNFSKNEITLSLDDLIGSDTKIVGIKNGKKTVLTSPSCLLPLFVNKKNAEVFINIHAQRGNLGFDKLIAEPVTEDEQRKFIVQKISHEIIHSQQHMIMRKTENIGVKKIIKAWSHAKPKNMIEAYFVNGEVNKMYNKSYWANQPDTEQTIKRDSKTGYIAKIWLEAIRNYPPVDSPEYNKNPIELDAYIRSAQYVKNKYGDWN